MPHAIAASGMGERDGRLFAPRVTGPGSPQAFISKGLAEAGPFRMDLTQDALEVAHLLLRLLIPMTYGLNMARNSKF